MEKALTVMSKNLITIHEGGSLDMAYALMKKNQIRHLPVLNENEKVVGILSDRDLQRALKSKVLGSGVTKWESCEFDPGSLVGDYMSWPVKTVDVTVSLRTLTDLMLKEKVSSYLVTKETQVVGIVTTDDLLKYLAHLLGENHETWQDTLTDLFSFGRMGAYAQYIAEAGV